jgi:hypothetical protein
LYITNTVYLPVPVQHTGNKAGVIHMRSRTCILCLGLIILCCKQAKENKPDNDLTELNLSGKIKSVKEISYLAEVQPGNIVRGIRKRETSVQSDYFSLFNTVGRYMERTYLNSDGSISFKVLYDYGSDGKLSTKRSINPDGRLSYRYVLKYDGNGNRVSEQSFNAKGKPDTDSVYSFNEKGKVTGHEFTFYGTVIKSFFKRSYTYDSSGYLAEMTAINSNGEIINRVVYSYDKDGNKTGESIFTTTGNTESIITFNNGNIISEIFKAKDNHLIYEKTYKYEYDGKKNWVQRIDYKNNIPEYIIEREIEYYE